jgi:hypothetical protein
MGFSSSVVGKALIPQCRIVFISPLSENVAAALKVRVLEGLSV